MDYLEMGWPLFDVFRNPIAVKLIHGVFALFVDKKVNFKMADILLYLSLEAGHIFQQHSNMIKIFSPTSDILLLQVLLLTSLQNGSGAFVFWMTSQKFHFRAKIKCILYKNKYCMLLLTSQIFPRNKIQKYRRKNICLQTKSPLVTEMQTIDSHKAKKYSKVKLLVRKHMSSKSSQQQSTLLCQMKANRLIIPSS